MTKRVTAAIVLVLLAACGASTTVGIETAADADAERIFECVMDGDCRPGQICTPERECERACVLGTDCPDQDKAICNPGTRLCVACLESTDCPTDKPTCLRNECQ
jgi:hypothetical protein